MGRLLLLVVTAQVLHLVRAGCPSGWLKNGGDCYYFQGTKTTYTQAPFYCDSLGGAFFAVPRSSSENDFIGSNVKYPSTWLAAVRPISNPRQEYGQYANYDSTTGNVGDDYTYMYPSQWKNGNCDGKRSYICESKARVGLTCTPSSYSPSLLGDTTKCFKIYYESTATFNQANDRCKSDGGQLVVFNNEVYRQDIDKAFKDLSVTSPENFTNNQFWIGYRRGDDDNSNSASFSWLDGTTRAVENWYPGYPTDSTNKNKVNCAYIFPSRWSTVSAFDAVVGKQERGYVCRKSVGAAQYAGSASLIGAARDFFLSFLQTLQS
ncbi:unnamed protein product [Darwinula stevensoni]|uniref:C-type lectin domain-containing protein n=1 Tax=Darwinula stevensoni TaxID=69355 RepID=A0A7R9FR36_9CRUS|nr:unnamed protein product [Darwinula stevensoni]CAG0900922.1 unnamed protein product [Darwinula stevensoni]